ncbi:MAG: hypothetical protein HFH86_04180 [Bacilli bacterium]|nr:hypothetical protein [Bacilli bacterium]
MGKKKLFVFLKSIFIIGSGLMMIGIVIVFLINHLLRIQVPERLAYIKDYQDFTLSVIEVEDCTNEVYSFFQKDNVIYNGVCIRDVYVNYGKTQAPLKLVLDEKYITLKDIQKKLSQVYQDDPIHYQYIRSDKENENYLVTIQEKRYQTFELTEVTFEILERQIKQEVKVSGLLEVS